MGIPVQTVISLGSHENVASMFAYPNTGHADQTLAQTIEHYLQQSVQREGLDAGEIEVSAQLSDGSWSVCVSGKNGAAVQQILERYQAFFDIAQVGLGAADRFRHSGKWSDEWKFFLPLGLPMAFARAIEVMDFPPITLIGEQDYLHSKTTNRWWELLMLNGVSDEEKCRYSCILDIVPVAAPAHDGQKLEQSGIYEGPFDSYGLPLLEALVRIPEGNSHRPLIVLGLPIRNWVQRNWLVSLKVGQIGTITLKNGSVCNVIGCNHPSFFFYAVHKNIPPSKEDIAAGLKVMKQDMICAAWHAGMGQTPDADPKEVLKNATAKWEGKDAQLLKLVYEQAGIPEPPQRRPEGFAPVPMAAVRRLEPTSAQLEDLERRFYAEGAARRD